MGDLVEKWIADGMDYFSGVALYGQIGKNKLLMRGFRQSNTISNQKKLEYELRSFCRLKSLNQSKFNRTNRGNKY